MSQNRALLFAVAFLFIIAVSARSQGGETGLPFLKFGAGGRSVAMGDAGVASAIYGSATHYNPALIASEAQPAITIMHNEWIQDVTAQYFGAVIPLGGVTLGLHIGLTSVADIEIRTLPGEPVGSFTSRDFSGGVSAAFGITDEIDFGVTLKYLFEKIYVDNASGYGIDAGLRVKPFHEGDLRPFTAGLSIANMGRMSALRTQSSKLPALARYGVAYSFPVSFSQGTLLLEADGFTVFSEKKTHLNVGAEIDYAQTVFVRLGYQTGYEIKGFSAGIGAAYSIVRFDYAFTPFSDSFGSAHTVAVSILF